jgi:hypothetical protein
MSGNAFKRGDDDHPSSKTIPDHEKGAPLIERPATSGSGRFDNSGQAPATPAATAQAGTDYVIDDVLDDEPNPSCARTLADSHLWSWKRREKAKRRA